MGGNETLLRGGMTPDAANAVFELGGAVLLSLNIRRILHDKSTTGVSVWPTVWWTAWGIWNLYYYHTLGQQWSWWAGVWVAVANLTWVMLVIWYRRGYARL
jgi:hypothetical protein